MNTVAVIKPANGQPADLNTIIPANLERGYYDKFYRLVNTDSTTRLVVFDPEAIGRGIMLSSTEEDVKIGMTLPTSSAEIDLFYSLVERFCSALGTGEYVIEGTTYKLHDLKNAASFSKSASNQEIEDMKAKLAEDEDSVVTLVSALNPITLGGEDFKDIDSSEKLGAVLHEKQKIFAYYNTPEFFKDPESDAIVGVYLPVIDADNIMPLCPPEVPNLDGEVGKWYICLYISDAENGYLDFDDFRTYHKAKGRYDAVNYLCSISEDEARTLLKEHAAAL